MKAKVLDKKFDANEDILWSLDLAEARRPNQAQKSVALDLPVWMMRHWIGKQGVLGGARQAIIKIWLGERLGKIGSDG